MKKYAEPIALVLIFIAFMAGYWYLVFVRHGFLFNEDWMDPKHFPYVVAKQRPIKAPKPSETEVLLWNIQDSLESQQRALERMIDSIEGLKDDVDCLKCDVYPAK